MKAFEFTAPFKAGVPVKLGAFSDIHMIPQIAISYHYKLILIIV